MTDERDGQITMSRIPIRGGIGAFVLIVILIAARARLNFHNCEGSSLEAWRSVCCSRWRSSCGAAGRWTHTGCRQALTRCSRRSPPAAARDEAVR